MVEEKGFHDNGDDNGDCDGDGANYISDRLHLEDMHPANFFLQTDM